MKGRTICLYAYYEKNEQYKENLLHFLKYGLNKYSDFLFIINGKCTVKIPYLSNVKIVTRANEGYDFGAWTEGVNFINIDNYDYFIFLNTSVRGPYLKTKNKPWQYQFTDLITHDTKLVGTTINVCTMNLYKLKDLGFEPPYTHVQSQMFAMDKECLNFIKNKIFVPHNPRHNFQDVIMMKEVAMSQYVLQNGWNINCLLPLYQNIDYRKVNSDFNHTSFAGDPSFKGAYFGKTYGTHDVIFIKTNRDVFEEEEEEEEEDRVEGFSKYIAPLTSLLPVFILLFIVIYRLTRKN